MKEKPFIIASSFKGSEPVVHIYWKGMRLKVEEFLKRKKPAPKGR